MFDDIETFHFDGHGINRSNGDKRGQRVAKIETVEIPKYVDGAVNPEFERLNRLFAAAGHMRYALERIERAYQRGHTTEGNSVTFTIHETDMATLQLALEVSRGNVR